MEVVVIGLSHKTAPLALRERLHVPEKDLPKPLDLLGQAPEVLERMLVSTCNRVEVYAVVDGLGQARQAIPGSLARYHGVPVEEFDDRLYTHVGREAVRHVFRVASSLDSMVVGEPQILGQVKDAYLAALGQGATGPILNALLEKAFHVAKRVRTETAIATSPVSVSSAAVALARQIFGDLGGRTALIIGAGEMAELALQHLVDDGVRSILVANRSHDRAVELAGRFQGRAITFDGIGAELAQADIVIGSTGAPHLVLRKEQVQAALAARKHRPLFLIDIALPRDIDPGCNDLDNVYLYDIDDLQAVVEKNKEGRQREAGRAEAIIEREVATFEAWLRSLEVVPTIVSLREKVEAIRAAEVARALGKLGTLTPEQREAVNALTVSLVNKILHQPMATLKREAAHRDGPAAVSALRRLFGLEEKRE